MSKKYPDVSVLFAKKEEWRRRMNERPLEEKFAVATQLKNLAKELPKLAKVNSQRMQTVKDV
jgi:hypothetical protein